MSPSLPLEQMSAEEKLRLMESLREDLLRRAADLPSPDWHGAILVEQEAAIEGGDDAFEDWEAARKKIEDEIR